MKITLKNTWLHFKKVCTHKYWVAKYCFKAGIKWQGIMHDMSKFSPIEFCESVRYYQGTSSPINACKKENGYSLAWQHHKGRNPHHYEYWTDNYDLGTVALQMPFKYAVELVCDWLGAGRAYYGKSFTFEKELTWWKDKRFNHTPKMNQQTINFVDIVFNNLASFEKRGKDPMEVLKTYQLEYFYKIAHQGDYALWKAFEKEMLESVTHEFRTIPTKVHVIPMFD